LFFFVLFSWTSSFRQSNGLFDVILNTEYSIGYSVLSVVESNEGIGIAQIRNKAGNFVAPTAQSVQAGQASAELTAATHFTADIVDLDGGNSWPIQGFTYIIIKVPEKFSCIFLFV